MARQQVTVDGVVLTRQQVEKALQELDKPEPLPEPVFRGGDKVERPSYGVGAPGRYGIVFGPVANEILDEHYKTFQRRPEEIRYLALNGYTYICSASDLRKVEKI